MEDSPLSITANVTGILTFAVAILASIYVRIVSLRSGNLELVITLKSVQDNVHDLMRMNRQNPSELRKSHAMQRDDGPNIRRLKHLDLDLIATELVIYIYCMHAKAFDDSDQLVDSVQSVLSTLMDAVDTSRYMALNNALAEISGIPVQESSMGNIFLLILRFLPSHWKYTETLLYASQRILTAGSSPTLIRWYRVRETVSEKVSMANSSAEKSEKVLQQLSQQQNEVKNKLEELTRLLTTASQASAPPASVRDSGSPAETHAQASPGQQEDIERHVDAEGSELETTDCCE
ncbi:hypothetical protein J4E85_010593 [Alternaria conjuncta]|uniref:uncharacterized protein n=1 Tax=Alternaria conjuncta TaxID=181017 RepID=UPI00221FE800|nr:uncharacterized protein J4E85_010593 [Alternaria conjuncta]KAI4914528.1 hypothetical protein J4E85_010593 [Alternaria conjuncta]